MATSVLAPGNSAAPSSSIVIASGESVIVAIYSALAGRLPDGVTFQVVMVTPGAENIVGRLDQYGRSMILDGPATYVVNRPAYEGVAFGVCKGA